MIYYHKLLWVLCWEWKCVKDEIALIRDLRGVIVVISSELYHNIFFQFIEKAIEYLFVGLYIWSECNAIVHYAFDILMHISVKLTYFLLSSLKFML